MDSLASARECTATPFSDEVYLDHVGRISIRLKMPISKLLQSIELFSLYFV